MKRFPMIAAALLFTAAAFAQCGLERWQIKTGTDPDAASVNMKPIDTTLADLRALTPPADIRHFKGRAPADLQVYTVMATLTLFKTEADSDYHLVIRDHGKTMIAELPKPTCASGSPWQQSIADTRSAFEQHFHGTKAKKNIHQKVRLTGVAFFDFIHGQTGVAPNGIELHPVLSITFQ